MTVHFQHPHYPVAPPDDDALDPGICEAVRIMCAGGFETYASCEGGPGHPYPQPTIGFHGISTEGIRAAAWAWEHGLRLSEVRRVYQWYDGELHGPEWQITFDAQP